MNYQKGSNQISQIDELSDLRRSTRDIVAISTLPSIWIHQSPSQVAENLVETLHNILGSQIAYVKFSDGNKQLEAAYTSEGVVRDRELQKLSQELSSIVENASAQYAATPIGPSSVNGVVIVKCDRESFPNETERLLLNIASNQANVTIQHKWSVRNLELERELRERFVNTLTHDLRTPLTAARMSAHILGRDGGFSEKQVSLSGRIVDNLIRVNQMIENLLDANTINAGKSLSVIKSDQEMNSLINHTLIDLVTIHGQRFVLKSSDQIINGSWSPDGIQRIMENLCANAVKYGDSRHPIEIQVSATKSDVKISVHNMGRPIPHDEQLKLFDPFQRLNPDKEVKGWGLGLTLVKGLVEAHGGDITVASDSENGTTFTISLPRS